MRIHLFAVGIAGLLAYTSLHSMIPDKVSIWSMGIASPFFSPGLSRLKASSRAIIEKGMRFTATCYINNESDITLVFRFLNIEHCESSSVPISACINNFNCSISTISVKPGSRGYFTIFFDVLTNDELLLCLRFETFDEMGRPVSQNINPVPPVTNRSSLLFALNFKLFDDEFDRVYTYFVENPNYANQFPEGKQIWERLQFLKPIRDRVFGPPKNKYQDMKKPDTPQGK